MLTPKTVPHGTVTFVVVNDGSAPTTSRSPGRRRPILGPGASAKLTVTLTKAKGYVYFCTVAGHAVAGMKGVLKVT